MLRSDGTVEAVGEPGTLLGVVPDPDLSCTEIELYRGDTVVFYTDGITEARTPDGMIGFSGLLSAVRDVRGLRGGRGRRAIEQRLLDSEATELRDDVALVVAQIAGGGNERLQGGARPDGPALDGYRPVSAIGSSGGSSCGSSGRGSARPSVRLLVAVLGAARHLLEARDPVLRRRVRGEELRACVPCAPSGATIIMCAIAGLPSAREGFVSPEIARSADASPCG